MILNLFLFITYPIIILTSTIGYGIFFKKKFLQKSSSFINLAIIGLFGLFFLYIISFLSHLIFPHNFIHNLLIIFIGIFLFFRFKQNIKKDEFKIIIVLFFLLFIGFFLSKTNEDFPFYHLPMSLQFVEQKLQFGLGNLNIGYNHFSSLFLINSLFYLPLTEIYLFNLTNFLFQIFFFSSLLILLNSKGIPDFVKILIATIFLIFLAKFNRLAEYGVDIPGQFLVTLSVVYCLISYFNEKKSKDKDQYIMIETSLYLMIFAVTTKILYSIYFIIPIIISFIFFKFKDLLNYFLNFRFMSISIFGITSVIFYNFVNSGCLIYPMTVTCFYDEFSWTLDESTIDHMSILYSAWSKGGIGAGYSVEDPKSYINSLDWVSHWINVYFFNKVSDYLLLIFFIFLLIYLLFVKNAQAEKRKKSISRKFLITYALTNLVFLYWFLNFPTLRYAGYSVVSLILVLPFVYFITGKFDINDRKNKKKFLILLIISVIIFNVRNIQRLDREFSLPESSANNYNNFPFYWVKNVRYSKYENEFITFNLVEGGSSCWATPSVCIRNKEINVSKKRNFIIFSTKK
tara:strand:- start:3491 stop:5203 length:1713 start_codon:yes stop_codon:yes gene_type:complete